MTSGTAAQPALLPASPPARPYQGSYGYSRSAPAAVFRVQEPPPDPISEADLAFIWEGKRYPAGALATAAGEPVEVVYPGRRGGGPGPDYRDAVVLLGGKRRLGDVEVHVRASSFRQHGHHLDPAYDGLALHVVFRDDCSGDTALYSGRAVPVAAFAPWVRARADDIASWTSRPALWQEPCHSAPGRLGGEETRAVLQRLGEDRLERKAEALADESRERGEEEALWRALFDALAFGGDRDGFRRLAGALPPAALRQVTREGGGVEALADVFLSAAGLAGDARLPTLVPPLRWRSGRPASRPERRLAAAAALFVKAGGEPVEQVRRSVEGATSGKDLVQAWRVPPLGQDRALEVVLNAVLPFAAGVLGLREQALALARGLPAVAPYGKTRFLERNLAEGRRRLARRALEQQGLLSLHASWCSLGGCGRCPLS